ncbi:hypothetical protein [Rathayibacter tritici]|uniref:hypothetical protein n=1 Tax=Rathayibacter tritici TaxID=33888 RepID=UPI0011AFFFE0|nr:hypothetical protein [Rathayibacter tritici]
MMVAQATNKWILVDADGKLILAGNAEFTGVSPSRHLQHSVSRALVGSMKQAMSSSVGHNQERAKYVDIDGEQLVAKIVVIRAPYTNKAVAAIGILRHPDEPEPLRPLVGAWEWCPVGDSSRTWIAYWTPEMFDIYRVSPTSREAVDGRWSAPQWLMDVVADADRLRMQHLISAGIDSPELANNLHYRVLLGYGQPSREEALLRLYGRAHIDEATTRLRGITHLSNSTSRDIGAGIPSYDTGPHFSAAMRAANSVAICGIDADTDLCFYLSPGYDQLEAARPPHGDFYAVIHPEDERAVRNLVAARQRNDEDGPSSIDARVRSGSGEYIDVAVAASSVTGENCSARYVYVHLRPTLS